MPAHRKRSVTLDTYSSHGASSRIPGGEGPRFDDGSDESPRRILLLGATGTTGRAVGQALTARGHRVYCFVRRRDDGEPLADLPFATEIRTGDVTDPGSVARDGFRGERFDTVVSCMASRTGAPDDAWAVDYLGHMNVLAAALAADVEHFIQLSAICVQKPRLEFQRAKLAFEGALMESRLNWTVIRPTAFFKSISGQLGRVRAGKPFLVFGDGELTACKPLGMNDLGAFVAESATDHTRWNRILPIGGPGPALTPLDHGALLFSATEMEPRYRHIPVALLSVIVGVLGVAAKLIPPLRARAELARIGHYYATESMLVWDPYRECYDADATPEFGKETLGDYYMQLARGDVADERGDHALI